MKQIFPDNTGICAWNELWTLHSQAIFYPNRFEKKKIYNFESDFFPVLNNQTTIKKKKKIAKTKVRDQGQIRLIFCNFLRIFDYIMFFSMAHQEIIHWKKNLFFL